MKTNENGYAVSAAVACGEYYLKELVAPEGYSLDTQVRGPFAASRTSAKTKRTGSKTSTTYTSDASKSKDGKLAG